MLAVCRVLNLVGLRIRTAGHTARTHSRRSPPLSIYGPEKLPAVVWPAATVNIRTREAAGCGYGAHMVWPAASVNIRTREAAGCGYGVACCLCQYTDPRSCRSHPGLPNIRTREAAEALAAVRRLWIWCAFAPPPVPAPLPVRGCAYGAAVLWRAVHVAACARLCQRHRRAHPPLPLPGSRQVVAHIRPRRHSCANTTVRPPAGRRLRRAASLSSHIADRRYRRTPSETRSLSLICIDFIMDYR